MFKFQLLAVAVGLGGMAQAELAVMSSQVGYDLGDPIRVIIRGDRADEIPSGATFSVQNEEVARSHHGPVNYLGLQWNAHWWVADLSAIDEAGTYRFSVGGGDDQAAEAWVASDPIEVGPQVLWRKNYPVIAGDYLRTRSEDARTGLGWKDCGSDLQEFSSHAVCVDGICDVLEIVPLDEPDRNFLLNQLIRGGDYMAHLQDKAAALGFGDGPVVHEDRDQDVVTGNIAKAAFVFARISRLIAVHHPEKSHEYLDRAQRAYQWLERIGPVPPVGAQDFFAPVHGAPDGSLPPDAEWMTRDLMTMLRASVELFRAGRSEYKPKALDYARRVMERQVPAAAAEGGFFGHFYTYGDFSSFGGIRFTEKANIHCGAWSGDGRIYNKGGHYPHYLLPLIEMVKLWPDETDAARWEQCLRDFTYGYLVPATQRSPFLILPAGYDREEGLLFFGNWYHAHNNIYAFTASLALELHTLFDDPVLRDIAVGNVQWIAGLNSGKLEEGKYVPVSMIYGIGARNRGSWSKIPGSVCNGFSASPQFRISPISADQDLPVSFDDEAYIAHSLPFLAALARLKTY